MCKGIFTREYDGLADFQEIPESRNPVHNDKLDARVCVGKSKTADFDNIFKGINLADLIELFGGYFKISIN